MLIKKFLSFLFISTSICSFSQLNVYTVDVTANDIVYDKVSNKIYASISSANGSNGNSIGIVNLETFQLEKTVFMGSEPTVLAISDDGKYIYAGFDGASIVRRFDVPNQKADLQFSLGADSFLGSFYVEDIEVMPGKANTIAVYRRYKSVTPRHGWVAIYDDNVMRPTTTPGHSGSNVIEFTSANSLIGYNNESTEYGIRRLSVNNGGVSNVSLSGSVLSGFNLNFSYFNNKMYSYDGKVVDVTTQPFVIGQFPNVIEPVVYDENTDQACFASYDWNGNISFKRFNAETFLLADNLPISQAFGYTGSIINCGKGCYAFNTSDNKIVIIKDAKLSTSENYINNSSVEIYPNPTTDFVYIKSDNILSKVEIYDISGKLIHQSSITTKIDIRNFSKGNYILKLIDNKGNVTTKQILKK